MAIKQERENIFSRYRWLVRAIYVNRVLIVIFLVLFLLGAYSGYLLFGTNSLEVLLSVRNKKTILQEEVRVLQSQNAKLQKQFFELKGLEP